MLYSICLYHRLSAGNIIKFELVVCVPAVVVLAVGLLSIVFMVEVKKIKIIFGGYYYGIIRIWKEDEG